MVHTIQRRQPDDPIHIISMSLGGAAQRYDDEQDDQWCVLSMRLGIKGLLYASLLETLVLTARRLQALLSVKSHYGRSLR